MMVIVTKRQVESCQIQGELAGRKQTFEGIIYQNREFIKIKLYARTQKIKVQKSCQKLVNSNIPAIIIKEKRGYSLWILFKSLLTQKHSIDSRSDCIRASVKPQGFNRFKALAICLIMPLIGTAIVASNITILIPQQTMQECQGIDGDCPQKIEALEKLTSWRNSPKGSIELNFGERKKAWDF